MGCCDGKALGFFIFSVDRDAYPAWGCQAGGGHGDPVS